ncbi:hypothetical protein [Dyella agri]|uniref:Uncharacterized protein n=1 Tax=Dyella agri TaxID=1926869 RepID=A0ABW8KGC4_9GAMM
MNVGELISRLQRYPTEARVVTPHFERGYDEITAFTEQPIVPSGWVGIGCGAYLDADALHGEPLQGQEVAVVLDWTES